MTIRVIAMLILALVLCPNCHGQWTETIIAEDFNGAISLDAGDVDGDGDPDVVAAAWDSGIAWIENQGGTHALHPVDPGFSGAIFVQAGDLDSDGDIDIVASSNSSGSIKWYENTMPGEFIPHTLTDAFAEVHSVYPVDMDGDGDTDILGASFADDTICWWRNNGSASFTPVTITDAIDGIWTAFPVDLDGDGDIDVAGAARIADNVCWWENDGAMAFSDHTIDPDFAGAHIIHPADIDLDGDVDLIATGRTADQIRLYLNDGAENFSGSTVLDGYDWPTFVSPADLDGDGDVDIACAAYNANDVSWLENDGQEHFSRQPIAADFIGAIPLITCDMDRDGYADVLSAAYSLNRVTLWENNLLNITENLVTGPGPGPVNPPLVRTARAEWMAYGVAAYGVNVTCGDLDGDGYDEVITGAGPGAVFGPHVRGWTSNGTPLPTINFLAYGTNKYGVNVAAGDIDGDGMDEIITGAGPGAVFGPHVRGWNVDGGTAGPLAGTSYFAYGTLKWGVNVTCGDIDGDGFDEIVTGAGPGAVFGPHVRGWNHDDGGTVTAIPTVSYFAYGTLQWGVNVACGDLDGDGFDEIITGPGPGIIFGSHVRGWNCDGSTVTPMATVSYFAYPGAAHGAVVSTFDVDGDGMDEILTMPGPDATQPARARAWDVDGGEATAIESIDFFPYGSDIMFGGRIAGGAFPTESSN